MKMLAVAAGLAALAATVVMMGEVGATGATGLDPADFSATIDHPLFPLSSLGPKVFEGTETDPDTGEVIETRLESRVLPETTQVAGVKVLVLEEKAYTDGELVEVALDYFAQHKDGSVYYLGERVDNYEDGKLANHDGQWLTGEGENRPGIIMPATQAAGQTYEQEHAPGIAEDAATVMELGLSVSVPAGSYTGCLKTKDFSPLTPGVEEFKIYCPGVGLVREEGDGEVLELVSVGASTSVPTPRAASASPTAKAGATVVPAAGSGPSSGSDDMWTWVAIAGAVGALVVAVGGAAALRRR